MKCLLIGYGNIGRIHSKYLNQDSIKWDWTDVALEGGVKNPNYSDYTHIFIVTPEHTHYEVYTNIKESGYKGRVFVEKPAVIQSSHFDIFDDDVFVGMVERYNPAVVTLKNACNPEKILNMDFSRCCVAEHSSKVSILEDIGIHDIDLYLFINDINDTSDLSFHIESKSNTHIANITNGNLARFIWSKDTYYKERKITIRQTDCTLEADLQDQVVKKHYFHEGKLVSESLFVEKGSPIYNEHVEFFNDAKQPNIKVSHELLLKMINE